jgi:hypothetical protein
MESHREVMVSLNYPFGRHNCFCPSDTFGWLRTAIDQVTETKHLVGIGFGFKNGAEGRPVGV